MVIKLICQWLFPCIEFKNKTKILGGSFLFPPENDWADFSAAHTLQWLMGLCSQVTQVSGGILSAL